MKKISLIVLLVMLSVASIFASGEKENAVVSDKEYVISKGKLVVGITDFEPMDYKVNNEWVGYDADMAKAFAKYLGVECEFIEIDWASKEMELDSKNVDCIWNGMTLTDGVAQAMETSNPYCNNAQVVVVKKDIAAKIKTAADAAKLQFAVEDGSAGMEAAEANGYKYVAVQAQSDAVMEVSAGTSQACIIDLLMAAAMVGEGTSYANLTYTVPLTEEKYVVGFRKGSELAATLNTFFAESYKNGSMIKIAEKYGTQASIIAQ